MASELPPTLSHRVSAEGSPIVRMLTAAGKGDLEELRESLNEWSSSVSSGRIADFLGRTPLMIAARNGRTAVVNFLLALGEPLVYVDEIDNSGRTSLMYAEKSNAVNILPTLMSAGADPAREDMNGDNAPALALKNGHVEALELYLRESPGLLTSLHPRSGQTLLHLAAELARYDACAKLCDLGAPVGARDHNGVTPLMLSASGGAVDICELLLDRGAGTEEKDLEGRDAEAYALASILHQTHGGPVYLGRFGDREVAVRISDKARGWEKEVEAMSRADEHQGVARFFSHSVTATQHLFALELLPLSLLNLVHPVAHPPTQSALSLLPDAVTPETLRRALYSNVKSAWKGVLEAVAWCASVGVVGGGIGPATILISPPLGPLPLRLKLAFFLLPAVLAISTVPLQSNSTRDSSRRRASRSRSRDSPVHAESAIVSNRSNQPVSDDAATTSVLFRSPTLRPVSLAYFSSQTAVTDVARPPGTPVESAVVDSDPGRNSLAHPESELQSPRKALSASSMSSATRLTVSRSGSVSPSDSGRPSPRHGGTDLPVETGALSDLHLPDAILERGICDRASGDEEVDDGQRQTEDGGVHWMSKGTSRTRRRTVSDSEEDGEDRSPGTSGLRNGNSEVNLQDEDLMWCAPEVLSLLLHPSHPSAPPSSASDLFSVGLVGFDLLTRGAHPYGLDPASRVRNILHRKRPDLSALERSSYARGEWVEAESMIKDMLMHDPSRRPSAGEALRHPYFWGAEKRLEFLREAADWIKVEPTNPPSPLIIRLESGAYHVLGSEMDWTAKLDVSVWSELSKRAKYEKESLRDLVKAVRNIKNHYTEEPAEVKTLLGPVPHGLYLYFSSRFPRLFMHIFATIVSDPRARNDKAFSRYWEGESDAIGRPPEDSRRVKRESAGAIYAMEIAKEEARKERKEGIAPKEPPRARPVSRNRRQSKGGDALTCDEEGDKGNNYKEHRRRSREPETENSEGE
ncbi:bifunctional endoribonuclease/protein kinase ire1 [Gonapodya sp. JEL0774]|nr:bifunctional endoribonuclease/protein kinase ire1 [Gonapodya sp. JEL0774]